MAGFPHPLVQALRRGDAHALARQLERFGDLEQRDAEGAMVLMRACASPRATACVALLLERGAAIEASDPWLRTPLLFALLRLGAGVDLADGRGTTALIAAVTWPYPDAAADPAGTLRALLEAGADRARAGLGSYAGPGIARTALELGLWQIRIVSRPDLEIAFYPNDERATLVFGFGSGPQDPGWSTQGTAAEQLARHGEILRREASWFLPFVERLAGGGAVDVDDVVRRAGGVLRFAGQG